MFSNSTVTPASKISVFEQCVNLCEHCLGLLDQSACLENEETVHEWRIATKRLRAAWHLVGSANRKFAKQRRSALRELSASIAGQRDRDVLLSLAIDLQSESDSNSEVFNPLLTQLSQNAEEEHLPQSTGEQLRSQWTEERAAWQKIASEFDSSITLRKIFRNALRKSERTALQSTRIALVDAKGDAELWHEWRKAVKRLRYQREFIAASQGRQLGVRDGRINRLGTRLGERNDLANLIEAVESLPELDRKHHGQIRKNIASRERGVLSRARRLGRLAFMR
jgi:CHAD domain-containing protein